MVKLLNQRCKVVYLNGYTTVFIDDNEYFDTVKVKHQYPEPWPRHINYNKKNLLAHLMNLTHKWKQLLLVFKNDAYLLKNIIMDMMKIL